MPTEPPTDASDAPTLPPVPPGEKTLSYPPPSEAVGEPLAPAGYAILGELGRGGMGVVYKARDAKLDRVIALKMILAGGHAGETELARFRNEATAVARLQHPNIVQIFEVGEHGGQPFLALEYCAGASLEARLSGGPLVPMEAARIVEALARAMQVVHGKGVVHRDLKPANVLFAEDGTPKITDFGLAKRLDTSDGATRTGQVMGTPGYMSPEQAEGKKEVGPAADVWALGAILYRLLTGRPPFVGATQLETILAIIHEEPVSPRQLRPGIARDLETICLTCLNKDLGRRYAGAAALADDLRRFLDGEPILARRPGLFERAGRWVQKHQALIIAHGVGILLMILLMIFIPPPVQGVFGLERARTSDFFIVALPVLGLAFVASVAPRRARLVFLLLASVTAITWRAGELSWWGVAARSGATHALLLAFLAGTTAWGLRRSVAGTALGAVLGAGVGLVLANLYFQALQAFASAWKIDLRFAWLYAECLGAYVGTLALGLLAGPAPDHAGRRG